MNYCSVTQRMIFEELAITEGLTVNEELLAQKCVDPVMAQEIEDRLKADPENADLWCGKAMIYFEDDFEKTIECLSMALAYAPFNSDFHHYRGRKYLSQDRYYEALAEFTMATRLDPGGRTKVHTITAPGTTCRSSAAGRGKMHYLGVTYYLLKMYENALWAFTQALDIQKKNDIPLLPPTVDWIWMANMKLGRRDDAEKILELVDETTPVEKDDEAYKTRVLLYKGDISVEDYIEGIKNENELHAMSEWYALSNYYYYTMGEKEKSLGLLDKVLAYDCFHHAFAYKLALAEREDRAKEIGK